MAQASFSSEKRPKRRNRVLLGGIVSYDDGKRSAHCTIRDITEAGARVALRGQQLPPAFFLINTRDRVVYEANVIWSRGGELGVSFHRTYRLADIKDPKLSYLAQLWFAHAAR